MNGSCRRCICNQDRVLDKPLETHEPCGVKTCGCGLFLDKLNATEIPELWNYYGGKGGLEPVPLDLVEPCARERGDATRPEAKAAESIKMSDTRFPAGSTA